MTYQLGIDVATIEAIDTHVHIEVGEDGHCALPQALIDAATAYFQATPQRPSLDEIADKYRALRIAAVVFTVDAGTALGHPANSSEEIAAGAARHNDILIPFGSVDPLTGGLAIEKAKRLAGEYGVRGFKFHPSLQGFDPSDQRHYPLYEALTELGLPLVFHTGQTGIGAGTPGGAGVKLGYSNPMLLDTVAADFPMLTIIMAHPSVPWQDEAISIATHKSNVYIDLSGWSPRYFPPELVKAANSRLQDKVLFGSDFPLITPERWLADFAKLDLKERVRPKILKANALRVLGLDTAANGT